jgi:hypothetical protein
MLYLSLLFPFLAIVASYNTDDSDGIEAVLDPRNLALSRVYEIVVQGLVVPDPPVHPCILSRLDALSRDPSITSLHPINCEHGKYLGVACRFPDGRVVLKCPDGMTIESIRLERCPECHGSRQHYFHYWSDDDDSHARRLEPDNSDFEHH